MAKLVHIVLLLALVCGPISVIAAADDDTTTTTEATTTESTTSTTTPKTTSSSTTTTEKTTTTTTTTTEKTTTESTSTTSTTTPAPPTPSTPVPDPERNQWVVKNGTKSCLMVDMAIQVNFTYQASDDTNKTALWDLPKDLKASGFCGMNATNMTAEMEGMEFDLMFMLNQTTKQYNMHMVLKLQIAEKQFEGSVAQNITIKMAYMDVVPQGKSYHCNRQQKLNATSISSVDETEETFPALVFMSQAQWQAFHESNDGQFALAKDCDAIDTPDIVPIAVGCALAGLVVIVLLGYLVGRRRSQNRGGYLSM